MLMAALAQTVKQVVRCPPATDDRMVRWANLAVLALAALSFLNIASYPLHDPDEFNYITAAREMVEGGDWITPHFNGAPRLVKPILFYWIVAGAYKVFGVHIATARLCSAAAAAVGVLGVWLTARQLVARSTALLAAIIAAGNLCVVQLSRTALTDPTLWAFVALANYAFVRLAFSQPLAGDSQAPTHPLRAWFSHLFFAATAMAMLTKGPVALAWCLLPFLWPLVRRDWAFFARLRWISGILIFLAMVAPWTALFIARNGPALRAQLLDPSSSQSYAHFARPVSSPLQFLGAIPQLATNFLLWLPAIVAILLSAAGKRAFGTSTDNSREQDEPRLTRRRFLLFWMLMLILLYAAFYKKSIRYMFPIVAPASILLADALERYLVAPSRRHDATVLVAISGFIALLLAIPLLAIIFATHGLPVAMIWPHVAIELIAGGVLAAGCGAPLVRLLFPAIVGGALYLHLGLLPGTLTALSGPGTQTLAPLVRQVLRPGEPLLCYEISPRVLVFEARRTQVDVQSFPDFLARLQAARACLIRGEDWQRVPIEQRQLFAPIGRCIVQRTPPLWTADLQRNRQEAILLARK